MAPFSHTRIRLLRTAAPTTRAPQQRERGMYGSQQQQGRDQEHHRLLPSYSPAGARRERDGAAHTASAWPATFEAGVETM